jgi:uncharacterized protein (DUF362 family)/NAD-dependent dihydropyrimidine dehydrogenase PreA subunit
MQTPAIPSVVALVKCGSYEPGEVKAALERGIGLLGGIQQFAGAGETLLVKPNALVAATPDRCVVTHPVVFGALCACLRKTGCKLTYGDSPAFYSGWGKCGATMRKAGFAAAAEGLGIAMADFENGTMVTNRSGASYRQFVIANGVLAASGMVSVPKFKTHGLTRITGAVKNQFGCVPGAYKGQYHARASDVHDFSRLLAAITAFVKPRLYVMDAVAAMEGNGPQNGDPRKLGLLMLSSDPVALDAIACKIIGLDPAFVPTCAAGEEAGLGTWRFDRITCVGDDIATFAAPDFKVTRLPAVSIPDNPAIRVIRNLLVTRPVIRASACTRCGRCIGACPVEPRALYWGNSGKARPPVYKYNKCIRCFCCQELCPSGAIRIKTPVLGRLLPVAAYLSLWISNIRAKKRIKLQRDKVTK